MIMVHVYILFLFSCLDLAVGPVGCVGLCSPVLAEGLWFTWAGRCCAAASTCPAHTPGSHLSNVLGRLGHSINLKLQESFWYLYTFSVGICVLVLCLSLFSLFRTVTHIYVLQLGYSFNNIWLLHKCLKILCFLQDQLKSSSFYSADNFT